MRKPLFLILTIVLVGSFCFGVLYGQSKFDPQVVYKNIYTVKYPEPEIQEITKPVYIERPIYVTVEKPVYLDKPIYQTVMVQNTQFEVALERFVSVMELRAWLDKYEEPDLPVDADCDDKAIAMFLQALRTGKYMSTEVIESQEHMVCSTIIGNDIYFVDNDKVIFRELGGVYWRID